MTDDDFPTISTAETDDAKPAVVLALCLFIAVVGGAWAGLIAWVVNRATS